MADIKSELISCCKQLRLSAGLAERAMTINGDTNQEFLLNLLESEIQCRKDARITSLMNTAGFPRRYTPDIYKTDEIDFPEGVSINSLLTLEFLKTNRNIIMYGNTGTGKTMLSILIGLEACRNDIPVMFFRTAALVNKFADHHRSGTLDKLHKKLNSCKILILDEFGYVPYDRTGSQLLYDYLSEVEYSKSIILTTNLEFSQWVNVLYDKKMTTALIGRLTHQVDLILFPGGNNRLRESSINDAFLRITAEKKEKLNGSLGEQYSSAVSAEMLWTTASLNHDRGYFSKYYTRTDFKRNRYAKQDLFCNDNESKYKELAEYDKFFPGIFAYTYDELLAYEQYAIRFHALPERSWDPEKYDHGLLGAAITYNKLMKDAVAENAKSNDDKELLVQHIRAKAIALTIAQHNIFVSSNEDTDELYGPELKRLYHNSNYKIGMKTPLLMFLNLIDTLELVKRFCKRDSNKCTYFYKDSLMKKVRIEVTEETITIDLVDFYEDVKEKISHERKNGLLETDGRTPMERKYQSYTNSILNISSWTFFEGKKDSEGKEIYQITMDKNPYNANE